MGKHEEHTTNERQLQALYDSFNGTITREELKMHPCAILKWAMDEMQSLREELEDTETTAGRARINGRVLQETAANAARHAFIMGGKARAKIAMRVKFDKAEARKSVLRQLETLADQHAQKLLDGSRPVVQSGAGRSNSKR